MSKKTVKKSVKKAAKAAKKALKQFPQPAEAAYAAFCLALLNLDETLSKE